MSEQPAEENVEDQGAPVAEQKLPRPTAEQLETTADREVQSARERAERSKGVGGGQDINFWLRNGIENLRRFASPGFSLTRENYYPDFMYPGYEKEDLAKLADILEARLPISEGR